MDGHSNPLRRTDRDRKAVGDENRHARGLVGRERRVASPKHACAPRRGRHLRSTLTTSPPCTCRRPATGRPFGTSAGAGLPCSMTAALVAVGGAGPETDDRRTRETKRTGRPRVSRHSTLDRSDPTELTRARRRNYLRNEGTSNSSSPRSSSSSSGLAKMSSRTWSMPSTTLRPSAPAAPRRLR